MSHRDTRLRGRRPASTPLAASPGSPVAAFESTERGLYGIQFHPEVVHTPYGTEILDRFLREIAGCEQRWSPASVIDQQVERIRAQVGDAAVICGLSGGVDSATAAALVHRAVGDQLTCVLVDHGLMRKNEAEQVVRGVPRRARRPAGPRRRRASASSTGSPASTSPSAKRKIIGEEFIRVFEEEAREARRRALPRPGDALLRRDRVRRRRPGAATIKSHHNVGGLPEDLDLELVEPLRMLFKDEVRAVAAELGPARQVRLAPAVPGPRPRRSGSSAAR